MPNMYNSMTLTDIGSPKVQRYWINICCCLFLWKNTYFWICIVNNKMKYLTVSLSKRSFWSWRYFLTSISIHIETLLSFYTFCLPVTNFYKKKILLFRTVIMKICYESLLELLGKRYYKKSLFKNRKHF